MACFGIARFGSWSSLAASLWRSHAQRFRLPGGGSFVEIRAALALPVSGRGLNPTKAIANKLRAESEIEQVNRMLLDDVRDSRPEQRFPTASATHLKPLSIRDRHGAFRNRFPRRRDA